MGACLVGLGFRHSNYGKGWDIPGNVHGGLALDPKLV